MAEYLKVDSKVGLDEVGPKLADAKSAAAEKSAIEQALRKDIPAEKLPFISQADMRQLVDTVTEGAADIAKTFNRTAKEQNGMADRAMGTADEILARRVAEYNQMISNEVRALEGAIGQEIGGLKERLRAIQTAASQEKMRKADVGLQDRMKSGS